MRCGTPSTTECLHSNPGVNWIANGNVSLRGRSLIGSSSAAAHQILPYFKPIDPMIQFLHRRFVGMRVEMTSLGWKRSDAEGRAPERPLATLPPSRRARQSPDGLWPGNSAIPVFFIYLFLKTPLVIDVIQLSCGHMGAAERL